MALDERADFVRRPRQQAGLDDVWRPAPRSPTATDKAQLDGAARGVLAWQWALVLLLALTAIFISLAAPQLALRILVWAGWALLAASAGVRFIFALIPPLKTTAPDLGEAGLPAYSIILPLYREASVVDELVGSMRALDYPSDRLQVILTLEADDSETIAAVRSAHLPSFCEILIAGPGSPRTKPRACNLALDIARGEYVVIYDAEDRPDPGQLREAAARFAAGPPDIACLQAPLRVERSRGFIGRQFALEYAVQFEVLLPAMARLGMAFPLGGTSNHFRTEVLRNLGGWDAYNVTEDADLGFRLSAHGWRMATIILPTWETPPQTLLEWLPQRTRWQKGHLQTLAVHTRRWSQMRRHLGSLSLTLLSGAVCALVHGPVMAWTLALLLIAACEQRRPPVELSTALMLCAGWVAAALAALIARYRTGQTIAFTDIIAQPLYWPLQSLAMAHAIVRLVREPFAWDKTPHTARQSGRGCIPPLSADNDRPSDRRRTARPRLQAVD